MPKRQSAPKFKVNMVSVPVDSLVRWVRMGVKLDHSLTPGTREQQMANDLWMNIMEPMPKIGYFRMKKWDEEGDDPFCL